MNTRSEQEVENTKREGEQHYAEMVADVRRYGGASLGYMTSWAWLDDPKRLAFTLSRYKFIAKMFYEADTALEVGCGDGFGARVVKQSVRKLIAIDFDPEFIESAKATASDRHPVDFRRHNILEGPILERVDVAYSMDVLEHIPLPDEESYVGNIVCSLKSDGVFIVGTPSLESQPYASKYSKLGHVNCKTQLDLRTLMKRFFRNVFMFSMNDEVIHTGFDKMSHYNLALCCGPRDLGRLGERP